MDPVDPDPDSDPDPQHWRIPRVKYVALKTSNGKLVQNSILLSTELSRYRTMAVSEHNGPGPTPIENSITFLHAQISQIS